jgi:hypothetical protein
MARSAVCEPPPQFEVQPLLATTIETDELLFAKFVSVLLADSFTVPMFVIVVPAALEFTSAAIVNVDVAPALMSPIVHAPVEVAYVPTDAVAFTNVSPEGKVSVATTPVEVAGPRAETVNV